MAYYHECPVCGAHLDPGETCDCEKEEALADREDRQGQGFPTVVQAQWDIT